MRKLWLTDPSGRYSLSHPFQASVKSKVLRDAKQPPRLVRNCVHMLGLGSVHRQRFLA
jgi:hypothetical protein